MQQVWDKLKHLKRKLKEMHKRDFANMDARIAHVKEQLDITITQTDIE